MPEYNLLDEAWIPCVDRQGRAVEHGIRGAILGAHQLREICDDSPLVTVAIHRLLLAVLYRGLEGPKDFTAWKKLYERGEFNQRSIRKYLDDHRERFDLFSEKHPFFQMGRFETKKPISVNRLATECASGNNATLFDHSGDEEEVEWTAAQAARRLIACQSFALGFGRSGDATINGTEEALPYSSDAIALRGMNVWLQGENLFETLMINLAPAQDKSLPPWELKDPNQFRDRLCGKERKAYGARGVIDRFTWQSRLIRLIPSGARVSRMYFTQGRSADKSAGDPMKVYRRSMEEGVSALPLSSGKAAWRDAHSIMTIPSPGSKERRPECFNLIARARAAAAVNALKPFTVQIVGLASAPNKAGKFLLWRHERMPIPAALLGDASLIERLGGLISNAEHAALRLNQRARRFAKLFLAPDCETPGRRQPDKDEVTRIVTAIDPRPTYWARLEKHFYALLDNLPNDWDETRGEWKPDDRQVASRAWRTQVKREAERAILESIRAVGTTARALQAIARVRMNFIDDDLKPLPPKSAGAGGRGET